MLSVTFNTTSLKIRCFNPHPNPCQCLRRPYQVAYRQHGVELLSHWVVLQSHEEGVEHNAYGDTQVQERIHHHVLHPLFNLPPPGAALPDQVPLGKRVPAGMALLSGLLQLCKSVIVVIFRGKWFLFHTTVGLIGCHDDKVGL